MTAIPLLPVCLLFVIIAVIVIVASAIQRGNLRSNDILRNWASENRYRIIQARRRYLFTGPFPQVTRGRAHVYRVTVDDWEGHKRMGWVSCGKDFWSTDADKTSVRWDK